MAAKMEFNKSNLPWWMFLIGGITSLLIGFLFLGDPAMSLIVAITFLGAYWLVTGILELVTIFIDSHQWGWKLLGGLLGVLAGVLVLQHPLWSAVLIPGTIVIVLGVEGIIIGVLGIVQAFQGGGWAAGIMAVLSIIFGLILLGSPILTGITVLPILFGVFSVVGGVAEIILAFQVRNTVTGTGAFKPAETA